MNNPTAILVGDIHLRDTTPICRTDDFFQAQADKIKYLCEIKEKYNVSLILDSGDMFHKWSSSPFLESFALLNLPNNIITVPGNHELPTHSLNLLNKSSLAVLDAAKKIRILQGQLKVRDDIIVTGIPYGENIEESVKNIKRIKGIIQVALIHIYVDKVDAPWFDNSAINADKLLDKLPQFDLILTGHNHQGFSYRRGNQVLVNPGAMMRSSTQQKNYNPTFYLWDAETNEIEVMYYPIANNVISIEHVERGKKRTERINAFVESLNDDYDIELSFEKNLDKYFESNKTRKPVENLIRECMV